MDFEDFYKPFDYTGFKLIDAWHGGLAQYECKECHEEIITECLTENEALAYHREKCNGH